MLRVQTESCILGSENIQQTSMNTMPGLYLDTSHPVTCQGQLTQWQLCYYRIAAFWRQYQASLQVWRDESIGQYTLIGASIQTATITFFDDQFMCINYTLTQSEYIPVLQGDIIGIYLEPRSQDNSALTVIGTANPEDFLFHTDQASSSDSMLQLSGLSRVDGVRMHMSVSIGRLSISLECTIQSLVSHKNFSEIHVNYPYATVFLSKRISTSHPSLLKNNAN